MAYCDPRRYCDKDQSVYDSLIHSLAMFGSQVIQDHYRVRLFSTDIYFDAEAIEELKVLMARHTSNRPGQWITQEPATGVEGLLAQMSQMDYVVTCRFHGVIFAHILNKPVLALSHHDKVRTLMKDIGLAEYCLDIRTLDAESLLTMFHKVVENAKAIRACMASTAQRYKASLTNQFDDLFTVAVDS
jgi:polysaccharide pyruvyl transferase WcaK-like protein